MPDGTIYLIGAGPGDPGLLTLRGAELLAAADVVVFDHLANPALLSHCRPDMRPIYVGKQSSDHTMTQDEINALLVREAKSGCRVVRLKGGDPFVFGRGGEECQALAEAGIAFEIVPGITAAIAAAAYAGIPVTHRDFNTSFTLLTGHEAEGRASAAEGRASAAEGDSKIDWKTIARLPCVAFYMGVKSLSRICVELIDHGMDPTTPAASIQWGTTSQQRTVVGTLADLSGKVANAGLGPPAITIVGKVVQLRQRLNWFETRPLFGQKVIVTRTRQQASDLTRKLQNLGASVIEAPTIELAPPSDWSTVDEALHSAATFDWIVFTSANGVAFTKKRLLEIGLDARALGTARIAAIGPATARAATAELALRVDLCPEQFVAEALAEELVKQNAVNAKRFLLLRADIARPILNQKLTAAGAAEVRDVAVYETHLPADLPPGLLHPADPRKVHWITFSSGGTVRNLVKLLGDDYHSRLRGVKIASIGPVTTAALREVGLEPTVQAATYDIDGLIAAMLQ